MAEQNEVDLDSVIDRLLEVRGSRPGKQVQLPEAEIRYLCTKAREIFIVQPILLELEAPIKVRAYSIFRLYHPRAQCRRRDCLNKLGIDVNTCQICTNLLSDLWRYSWPIL